MKITISCAGTFHATLMANDFSERKIETTILSSAPRPYFGALARDVSVNFVPQPFAIFTSLSGIRFPSSVTHTDILIYDRIASLRLSPCDLFVGWAYLSLNTAKRAKRLGAAFALERSCPHVDFQQQLLREEAAKLGFDFKEEPQWFLERQCEEYSLADHILVPSKYSADTFPVELRDKIIVAPLYARLKSPPPAKRPGGGKIFTVGVVGGDTLRKGYLYLLQAWKKLNLPNAVLRLRAQRGFDQFPVLRELADQCPNLEFVDYVKDMNEFYQGCDLFVLPSVDDGFGMALLEAMANGVASIATTRCGAVELLKDREDIYLVKPFDADEIALAIDRLYRDPEYRLHLGNSGRETVAGMLSGSSPVHYHEALNKLFN
jgi:glycosyltransferase involved in cell wall biosynthesis